MLFLGLDSSTQSLSAVAIDDVEREIVLEHSINFDEKLPKYGTENGVLPDDDPRIKHSSPHLWADAIDVLFAEMKAVGFPFGEVKAIAVSGQQHGSVYLKAEATKALASLETRRGLADAIRGVLSRPTSPIWMDSSTAQECAEITAALGGPAAVAELTGSCAFERFTGPQIRKFWKTDPSGYKATDRIHLVSSFVASLLAGRHAPIDPGDGAGMNLMDIRRRTWAGRALDATAPGLASKLPPIAPSDSIVGPIARPFVVRHGFAPDAKVVPGSGDNPNSLIGVGLVEAGKVAISLGTSDTYFGFMPEVKVDPAGEGHVFGSPTGDAMSLICFKNGSLARERIRDAFGMDWAAFSDALEATPPGNGGGVLLPYFEPEIVPKVLEPGVRRYNLPADDGPRNVRAVVEAQLMSMRIHSRWMGVPAKTIYATGGGSANRAILRIMADVHDAEVFQFEVGKSAALGAALRASHAWRKASGEPVAWPDVVRGFAEPIAASRIAPDPANVRIYARLMEAYRACEDHALRGGRDPGPKLARTAS